MAGGEEAEDFERVLDLSDLRYFVYKLISSSGHSMHSLQQLSDHNQNRDTRYKGYDGQLSFYSSSWDKRCSCSEHQKELLQTMSLTMEVLMEEHWGSQTPDRPKNKYSSLKHT